MTNTEKFFVECVKCGINNQKITAVFDGVDFQYLYKLCVCHSMSVAVFSALENVQEKLPAPFVTRLRRLAGRHVMLDVQSGAETQKVLSAMHEKGIKYMPLKGYYIKQLYPSTQMRYTSDCDVLIDKAQLDTVRSLMKNLDYKAKRFDEHHDIYVNAHTGTVFELHKSLFVGQLQAYFQVGFERAHTQDGCLYTLNEEDFYISILAHSAYHFAQGAGVGIRHLADVYIYNKHYTLNQAYLAQELTKCGLLAFKNAFEKLAAYFFEGAQADEMTLNLAQHVLHSSLLGNTDELAANQVAAQGKKRALWRLIFPKKEHMQFSYPFLKRAVWLLPLFYPVRWLHVLFTRPKRLKKLSKTQKTTQQSVEKMRVLTTYLGTEHLME